MTWNSVVGVQPLGCFKCPPDYQFSGELNCPPPTLSRWRPGPTVIERANRIATENSATSKLARRACIPEILFHPSSFILHPSSFPRKEARWRGRRHLLIIEMRMEQPVVRDHCQTRNRFVMGEENSPKGARFDSPVRSTAIAVRSTGLGSTRACQPQRATP